MVLNNMKELITVDLIDNGQCTGCKACEDACPMDAINFEFVNGFWTKSINKNCIACGKCLRVCPVYHEIDELLVTRERYEQKAYGIINRDNSIRYQSTSGGFFHSLAAYVIELGGYVCGAVYDENFMVRHIITLDNIDIVRMMKSKYAQSDTSGIYSEVKEKLENDKLVLFSGTPCQVHALKCFLGRDYENLISLDFICCGISSPLIFEEYLRWLQNKYRAPISNVDFKNKKAGWRAIGTRVSFKNGKEYFNCGSEDPYMISFVVDGNNIRESCYNCKYRQYEHISDYTVGDFWGMEKKYSRYDDNMGTTALIVNSKKGELILNAIESSFEVFNTTLDDIASGNFTLLKAKHPRADRLDFISKCEEGKFEQAIKLYSSYSRKQCFKNKVFRYLKRMLKRKQYKKYED